MAEGQGIQDYFQAATAWELDRRAALETNARRAWQVAAAATLGGLAAIGALAFLMPLKTVVPYVIRVDNSTGVVDVVPAADGHVQPSEAMTRYLINAYVTARERYISEIAPHDYALVGSMQAAELNSRFAQQWDRANPESPLNRIRDGASLQVQIHSISALSSPGQRNALSQVRFTTTLRNAQGSTVAEQPWIATLAYQYRAPSRDYAQRELNPLGFRVTEYQREPEIVAPAAQERVP